MILHRDRGALVLVDYQSRLMPAIDGAEEAIRHGVFLADVAHAVGVPVIGTEQNPQGLGPNDERIRSRCDRTVGKMRFDACGDGLLAGFDAPGRPVDEVVVAGCEAHVCLTQTALGLLGQGMRVFVVPAACGSRRAADKALAMQRLAQAGATLLAPEMVAFEWLESSDHPQFKHVLGLVKGLPV